MSSSLAFFRSSIGKKVIMALTAYSVMLPPFGKSMTNAIPGLIILTILSFVIVRYRQRRNQA